MNAKTFVFLQPLPILDFIFQYCYNPFCQFIGSLAQLVEQRTLNPLVEGSNPSGPTKILYANHALSAQALSDFCFTAVQN